VSGRYEDTLHRLEDDDRSLTGLSIAHNDADFVRIGDAIRKNTHLKVLEIDMLSQEPLPHLSFFKGLQRNSSIRQLILTRANFCGGFGYRKVLDAFAEKHDILTKFCIGSCDGGNVDTRAIVSFIRKCTNLNHISVKWSSLGRSSLAGQELPHLKELIVAIRGLPKVEELNLGSNLIDFNGCGVLATLLQDPNSKLRHLFLGNNLVDNRGATLLADALAKNTKLECLNLENNRGITEDGLGEFSKVMCNTSSISDTYSSNHTLKSLGIPTRALSTNLLCNMTLNNGGNKKKVAMKKILWKHRHFDMEPFFEWDMKMLTVVIGWFDRARGFAINNEANNLYAIYQFIRAFPDVVETVHQRAKATRKRRHE